MFILSNNQVQNLISQAANNTLMLQEASRQADKMENAFSLMKEIGDEAIRKNDRQIVQAAENFVGMVTRHALRSSELINKAHATSEPMIMGHIEGVIENYINTLHTIIDMKERGDTYMLTTDSAMFYVEQLFNKIFEAVS